MGSLEDDRYGISGRNGGSPQDEFPGVGGRSPDSGGSPPLVAFIFSPLQALNLFEFCQRYSRRLDIVVVGCSTTLESNTRIQIESILSLIGPRRVMYREWSLWASRPMGARRALASGIDKLQAELPVESADFIVGEYRSAFSWAALRRLKSAVNSVVVVDDGTAMLRIDRRRPLWRSSKRWREKLKTLIFLAQGLRGTNAPRSLTFFTAYALSSRLAVGDTTVHNDYRCLRRELQSLPPDEDHVYVIGTPHLEVGVVSGGDVELALELGRFAAAQTGKRVIYMPHRRERAEKLEILRNEFTVVMPDVPFEIYPRVAGKRPMVVVGYYSSLFVTVSELFDNCVEILALDIPRANVNQSWRSFIDEVYQYYRADLAASVKVVEPPKRS